ncbi:MAG: nuclear transport factor 2 family protein [Gammaproteobacteria bacterium]|nr:nuclear transport factor 2 family protein [Gammaproteobacteria bacterium]MBT8151588.1 nuclear transport factor 2 family protein [Gammaproteobacteria bacterium]NNM11601.1 SnoaL-like domain-containing protein [Pseudomonadales bacterium]
MNDSANFSVSSSLLDTSCPAKDTPAMRAHRLSIANAGLGNKQAWLDLFDDNAVVHDPVGKSQHDPEGKGFAGKARLEEFWDTMIGPVDLLVIPQKRINVGDNIACVVMTSAIRIHGIKTYMEMVAIYETNDAGKLTSLKVYWDVDGASEILSAN